MTIEYYEKIIDKTHNETLQNFIIMGNLISGNDFVINVLKNKKHGNIDLEKQEITAENLIVPTINNRFT